MKYKNLKTALCIPTTAGMGWRHPHYGQLLETRPALGFIEVHSENFFGAGGAALAVLAQARAHYPVSLHGVGLSLGSAIGIDEWHLAQLAALVERTEPWLVSDHASFARGPLRMPNGDSATIHAADLLPIPFTHEALDMLCANVQRVQERLQRPIAVENLSAYLHWNPIEGDAQTEPEFLTTLAQRTGCQLLVDVNNLYVNALNVPATTPEAALRSCRAWLDAIPPQVVAEIHLAGHTDCGDIVIDDHGSRVCEAVWSLYAHATARFGRVPTLIEWDTDIPALQVLLDEVARADRVQS
jgi:uncharacterized protein